MCSSVYKTHSEVPGGYKHNEGIRAYSVVSSLSILSLSLSLSPSPSLPPPLPPSPLIGILKSVLVMSSVG